MFNMRADAIPTLVRRGSVEYATAVDPVNDVSSGFLTLHMFLDITAMIIHGGDKGVLGSGYLCLSLSEVENGR